MSTNQTKKYEEKEFIPNIEAKAFLGSPDVVEVELCSWLSDRQYDLNSYGRFEITHVTQSLVTDEVTKCWVSMIIVFYREWRGFRIEEDVNDKGDQNES